MPELVRERRTCCLVSVRRRRTHLPFFAFVTGLFHSDVWALISPSDRDLSDPSALSWRLLDRHPGRVGEPEPRGWFASSGWYDQGEGQWNAVMVGGLNSSNQRLKDAWKLSVQEIQG
jgi:hypothetical protein